MTLPAQSKMVYSEWLALKGEFQFAIRERDRYREALEQIADQGPEMRPGVPWTHWRVIAREALDA